MRNKKLLLLVSVLSVAVLVSVILWLVFAESPDTTENPADTNQSNIEAIEPKRVEVPDNFDSSSLNEVPREESFAYNDQIISPHTVSSNPNDYLDKQITVRGWILEPSEGMYILTSINSDEQKALVLANNDSLKFDEYANTSSDYSKTSKPVTLVGTFSLNASNGNVEFIVESLEQ